jgi:vesicular inhibitory amino acid transporter
MALAITGILMFGDGAADEITYNILALDGYPKGLSVAMVVFIAMIPLTKTPLNSRPIITTIEIMLGVDPRALPEGQRMTPFNEGIMKIVIRSINPLYSPLTPWLLFF